jgi:magnesium-transporting ATPase (P-type)
MTATRSVQQNWLTCAAVAAAAGDKVVADGLVVESYGLVVDEASLTGESDPIKKSEEDPWCRSGTQVRPTVLWLAYEGLNGQLICTSSCYHLNICMLEL